MGFFEHMAWWLGPWSWIVLGIVLALLEIVIPGSFLIWFALAALVTGVLTMLIPLGWQASLLIFAVLAALALLLGIKIYGRGRLHKREGGGSVNDRVGHLIGRTAVLDTPLTDGSGYIRLDDTRWRVEGPTLPAGSTVKIIGYRDGRLQVAAV